MGDKGFSIYFIHNILQVAPPSHIPILPTLYVLYYIAPCRPLYSALPPELF